MKIRESKGDHADFFFVVLELSTYWLQEMKAVLIKLSFFRYHRKNNLPSKLEWLLLKILFCKINHKDIVIKIFS